MASKRVWLGVVVTASLLVGVLLGPPAVAGTQPTTSDRETSAPPRIPSIYGVGVAQGRPGALDEYCAQYGEGPTWTGVRPATIDDACIANGLSFSDLTWTAWTARSATGRGVVHWNPCIPSCMEGTWKRAPVRVTFSAPIKTRSGVRYFTVMTLTPRDRKSVV